MYLVDKIHASVWTKILCGCKMWVRTKQRFRKGAGSEMVCQVIWGLFSLDTESVGDYFLRISFYVFVLRNNLNYCQHY